MNPLSYLSVIRLRGADVQQFLHNQLSAEINALQAGQATFADLCQIKGRVIALLLVQLDEEGAFLVCAKQLAKAVAKRLGMFVLRDDVQISIEPGLAVFGVGNDTEMPTQDCIEPLPGLAYLIGERRGDDSEDNTWKATELAHGIAWLNAASTEKFLPQMLGHESIGALNFRKGCYPGQEIIARTHYLGKLKRNALLAEVSTLITPESVEEVSLQNSVGEASAVVVETAPVNEGTRLILVARAPVDFHPVTLRYRDGDFPIECRWLNVEAR